MTLNYLNIPYSLGETNGTSSLHFLSIWKVEVNDQYKIFKPDGFANPGIFLTYEGRGQFDELGSRRRSYVLGQGSVFAYDGTAPCRYHCVENGAWKFYFIDFTGIDFLHGQAFPIASVVQTNQLAPLKNSCERIMRCIIQRRPGASLEADILFGELMLLLVRERGERRAGKSCDLSPALFWMHENIEKTFDLDLLVQLSAMSRTLFFRRFKAETGHAPSAYFNALKLEAARLALRSTGKTIKEIAESLQFCDEFHFSKAFKRFFGEAPAHYRARYEQLSAMRQAHESGNGAAVTVSK